MDKSVLKKALADSEEPTPGYLFRDIAKMTYVDSNTQDKLVAYLFEKLSVKNSVHVLSKTLNVIKHLCKEGHADFQKTMQRKSDDMKQFATYRGPTDPKYGDKLNERVRTYAREAIDAAFSARRDTNVNIGQGTGGGSAPTNTASSGGGGGVRAAISNAASSVSGFVTGQKTNEPASLSIPGSNERCAPMPTTNKWAEHMASQQTKNGGTGFGFMNNMKDKVNTGFGMWEQGVQSKEERMMAELNSGPGGFQAVEIPGQFNKQGGAGGGSKAMQANSTSNSGFGGQNDGGGWKFTQESQGGGAPAGSQGGQQKKVQTVLEREVEKLATMKSTPKRVELSQFLTAIHAIIVEDSSSNYTYEDLASAMDAHLSGKNTWQSRLNTLSAVEYILRAEEPQPGAEFKEYFTENPEDIQRNVAVVQEALKEKAQKVLKILGVPDRLEVAKQQAEVKKQQQQIQQQQNKASAAATQQTNLDGTTNWSANMTIDNNNSTSAPSGGASTDDVSGAGGFLDGMTVKSGGGGGTGAGGAKGKEAGDKTKLKRRGPMSLEAFDNNNNQQQNSNNNNTNAFGSWSSNNNNNDDGGWGSSSSTAPSQQQQQQQQAPPKSAVSLDDIFGGTAPTTATTTTSSSTSQQQQQQPKASSSAGSFDPFASAFGGGEQAPKQQQQQQQQTPSSSVSPAQSNVSVPSSVATSSTPAPAPAPASSSSSSSSSAVDAQKQQLAQQVQQQMMMLMQQSMAAAQRGDTQTAQTLMQQQQQLMAQMTAMMGGAQ